MKKILPTKWDFKCSDAWVEMFYRYSSQCLVGLPVRLAGLHRRSLLTLIFFGISVTSYIQAQQITLKKGIIIDSIQTQDSIPRSFALYLPTKFEAKEKWPLIIVFDMEGRGKQVLSMFKNAAEAEGYILAAPNKLSDSLPLSKNIVMANRVLAQVVSLLPVHKSRVYTAGFSSGAKLASVMPSFVKQVEGVISCGSAIPNMELLNSKNPFHFIGIVGKDDFNYTEMLRSEKVLNKMKFPNHLFVFDGGHQWPKSEYIQRAMETLTLSAMAKGNVAKDESYVQETLTKNFTEIEDNIDSKKMLDAYQLLNETISIYRVHTDVDSLVQKMKSLKKDKLYRAQKRNENNFLLKESFIKEDYKFSILEDIETLNYNNLGWWNYQMGELRKHANSSNTAEQQMGKRLIGYLNALVEDNIDIEMAEKVVNWEAVSFLWQLKTITDPKDYSYYLKIISDSARLEDFGTALFYLEELLKNGYKDKDKLYDLEHTALLKITPEYNKIVEKYLKDARYEVIEE